MCQWYISLVTPVKVLTSRSSHNHASWLLAINWSVPEDSHAHAHTRAHTQAHTAEFFLLHTTDVVRYTTGQILMISDQIVVKRAHSFNV